MSAPRSEVRVEFPEEEMGFYEKRSYDRRNSSRSDEYDDWDSRFMLRSDHDDFNDRYNETWGQKGWFKPSCIPISIILVLIVLVVLLPLLDAADKRSPLHASIHNALCQHNCSFTLVESIPEGLTYNSSAQVNPSTFATWSEMIASANSTIEIASYYWTLTGVEKNYPGTDQGAEIFAKLLSAGRDRGLKVKIVQSAPTRSQPNLETGILASQGRAEVRNVSMPNLVGGGVLHTKLWMIDRKMVYIGSANTDWRSLTQVKELGLFITDCPCVVNDIAKIFDVYWSMGVPNAIIPDKWPDMLNTDFNMKTPLITNVNKSLAAIYTTSSPPQFCPKGRTSDIDGVWDVIERSDKFVYIAVMDYIPLMIYSPKQQFWPLIDNALKKVAIERDVEVRLLISWWNHTRSSEISFLKSFNELNKALPHLKISVKMFVVPSDAAQAQIPFARVNHNKYMVTDNTAFIGTSNWSGDYFVNTAGLSVVVSGGTGLRDQLEAIFLRDWESPYAHPIQDFLP